MNMEHKVLDITSENTDSVVFSVIQQFKERANVGLEKYGTNMDRTDLSTLDWIRHAQEEHMDAILYLEKLKQIELSQKSYPETQYIRFK
jgi:hypothetical protein